MAFDWLNEHSQTFLERGYLLPGQTVQERVREITDKAEHILGKE
jgi:ribonucleoside-diphosphate reductase alpha chain